MKKFIYLLVILMIAGFTASAQWQYPPTKKAPVKDTYFGVTYTDNYRWIEAIETPEVEGWFRQQADYSKSILDKLNGRDELVEEWTKLDKLQPPRINTIMYENGRIFYKKRMPGETVSKLYYRQGVGGKEILLFDPLDHIKGKTLSIDAVAPSFDGKKIAIGYAEQGAEVTTIRVMEVDTRNFLPDSLYPTAGVNSWSTDNKAILYLRLSSANSKDPRSRLNPKCMLHILGQDPGKDRDFFSNAAYPELKIDSSYYPFVFISEDSKNYLFSGTGSVQPELNLYYAPIGRFNDVKVPWKTLCQPSDSLVRGFAVIDDDVYAISHNQAKNYKLIHTTMNTLDWSKATVIAPERTDRTLESFTYTKDYLLITYSDGINNFLEKYNRKTGKTTQVKLPFPGTIGVNVWNTKTNSDCTIGITSWIKPYTEFNYDATTDKLTPGSFNQPSNYPEKYRDLVVEEVEVKGHDGVMIPLSIIYKKGLKKDGSNPCLMDGYGAYGSSATPWFSMMDNALAVRGTVIAYAHIRGGSEKGQAWYMAGYKTTKPNTWKDFISCGEYLVKQGFTSPAKLAGSGTSAGGILISRAVTERPDLFAAAICNVGCANTMRGEFGANGPVNIPEFGTVKDSVECLALYEMDGMHHVVDGVKYPAVICVAGWNDPRVVPWEPGKFAAALQNATTSGKPVLLKVNYDNGHFTEDRKVTYANFADQYSFVMWQCGHPGFQLKK